MRAIPRALVALAVVLLVVLYAPMSVAAAEPTFGEPTATAVLGEPITISSSVTGDDIESVEVLVRLVGEETAIVLPAEQGSSADAWQVSSGIDVATSSLCACVSEGNSAPNTRFTYQFRVRGGDGTVSLGPVGEAVVSDTRFAWQTLEQDLVRVHWYAGDEAFAQSAADVANTAIDRASQLLGAGLDEPVDLFVYDTEEAMRSALSPNRENVAGQAHAAIQTMFVHIPAPSSAEGARALIAHELTHLVFDAATANDYHGVPRWIDEGVAVYLSEGYTPYWKSFVDRAVADGSLIPLDGLRGLFPSTQNEFALAYGESVAAIDFFIRTYGEETLWELVRSYATGVSDDDAFTQATGGDVAAFNAAWFESLGLDVPPPLGPQPGQPGPQPSDWQDGAATPPPAPAESDRPAPRTGLPSSTARPATPPALPRGDDAPLKSTLVVVGWLLLVGFVVSAVVAFVMQRSRARPRRDS